MDLTNEMFLYVFSEFDWDSKSVTGRIRLSPSLLGQETYTTMTRAWKATAKLGVFKVFVNHDTSRKV